MIYYDNGYKISTTKVHYIEETEGEVIKFIPESKEYWQDFHDRGIVELKGFIEEDNYTEEQKDRLKKINELKIPEGVSLVEDYILYGKFEKEYEDEEGNKHTLKVNEGHPLHILKLSEENKKLQDNNKDLAKKLQDSVSANKANILALIEVNSRLNKIEKEVK